MKKSSINFSSQGQFNRNISRCVVKTKLSVITTLLYLLPLEPDKPNYLTRQLRIEHFFLQNLEPQRPLMCSSSVLTPKMY